MEPTDTEAHVCVPNPRYIPIPPPPTQHTHTRTQPGERLPFYLAQTHWLLHASVVVAYPLHLPPMHCTVITGVYVIEVSLSSRPDAMYDLAYSLSTHTAKSA